MIAVLVTQLAMNHTAWNNLYRKNFRAKPWESAKEMQPLSKM